jgi:VWFA-related protein
MPKAILIAIVALLAIPPAFAAQNVTVEQLKREVTRWGKKRDAKVADRLYDLQLAQRLSTTDLTAFEAALPGPKSRRALVALADQAEFLDPPPAEIPALPAPSFDQQRALIARSVDYVQATQRQLPNLFARQDTIRYEDVPAGLRNERTNTIIPYAPLHPVSRFVATVLYRDGEEIAQKQAAQQGGGSTSTAAGLITSGEFGSIFPVVYGDLPAGNLTWSHWERGRNGPEAVFHFAVPKAASHYKVSFCCVMGAIFQQFSAYQGELTLDPSNGTILRLTLMADLEKEAPVKKADLMVEYGPVELGGKRYFCPVRSVSISVAPMSGAEDATGNALNPTRFYVTHSAAGGNNPNPRVDVPLQSMLNETIFDQYHLFRADLQILTDAGSEGGMAAGAAAPLAASAGSSPLPPAISGRDALAPNQNPAQGQAMESTAASSPASNRVEATSPTVAAPTSQPTAPSAALAATKPSSPSPAPSAAPPDSEMAIASSDKFPQAPGSLPSAANPSGYALSLNSRLVDVDVTAFDKKGRPITGLSKKDFDLDDNGRRQVLLSFTPITAVSLAGQHLPATAASPVLYSNLSAGMGSSGAPGAAESTAASSTILLLDESSLDFSDLNYARREILKFLDRLPASEPAGLYVRTGSGFSILAEESTGHAALSSALQKWMPKPSDLARAQEAERRNRQQFDYVDSPSEMQYVNGNMGGTMAPANSSPLTTVMVNSGANPTSDPKLMKEGQNPVQDALAALVAVAARMNAIPGHKNLIWVVSDNVLANWTDRAPGLDQGTDKIGKLGLVVQEALNDAHVSLYPLDASQLETTATDASLQNESVQLNPAISSDFPGMSNAGAPSAGSREKAESLQDTHAVRSGIQFLAQATGGRVFRRSGNLAGDLHRIVAESNAAYLLSFAPDAPPDGKYHRITITVPGRRGISLRYRQGYLYTEEPAALKARFKQAVWQPQDETGIGLRAHWDHASQGAAVSLQIAATDIALLQKGDRWTDRLDVFLVQRDPTGTHAAAREQTLVLNLMPATYQQVVRDGIPFAEYVNSKQEIGTVRIIVIDENSGRMGSVTLPVVAERAGR